jgi:Kef-type K+ transport system membrane component KefB
MPAASLASLAVVLATAFVARLLLGLVPRFRLPGVVLEIILGIVIGPAVLGWARADQPVALLATLGVTFLLFLAGLEVDLAQYRGALARLVGIGFLVSFVLAVVAGESLAALGVVHNPLLIAVALTATSLGLVVPVLGEAGATSTPLGRFVIASASLGDVGAVLLLSLLFSRDTSTTSTRLVLLGAFALAVVVVGWSVLHAGRSSRISALLVRLQDTSAQIRVRGAMVILIGLVVLAQHTGLETILAAFVAGGLLGFIDRDAMKTHPQFQVKLDAIGHGFLVPIFFVASGVRFDLRALTDHPAQLARVPLFALALLFVRGLPALLYRSQLGARQVVAAGLFQATSLPFLVTAAMIGNEIGALTNANAAALVGAGLLSALLFPVIAVTLLKSAPTDVLASGAPEAEAASV